MKESIVQYINDDFAERDTWYWNDPDNEVIIWNVWNAHDGQIYAHIGDKLVTITVDVKDYPA